MPWAPDYVTTAELREYVTRETAVSVDDAFLALAISAASRAIDRATNRQFGSVTPVQGRAYTATYSRKRCRWIINVDDFMDDTGLEVTVGSEALTLFSLGPTNADVKGRPYTQIVVDPDSTVKPTGKEDEVSVAAVWGWTAVPTAIKQATLLQASRVFKRRDAPFGVAGSPDVGSEMRLLAKVDPDVEVAVGPYKRWWAAA